MEGGETGHQQGEALGYFVPEADWEELQEAAAALSALRELSNTAPTELAVSSDKLRSLFDVFCRSIGRVKDVGQFCRQSTGASGNVEVSI